VTGKTAATETTQRFIIERNIEGAADLSAEQLAEIAKTSNSAVDFKLDTTDGHKNVLDLTRIP